jgi:hypothetical protein
VVSFPSKAGPLFLEAKEGFKRILVLQEVNEKGRRPRQEIDRGEYILDKLEEIRGSLLFGSADREMVSWLLEQKKYWIGDRFPIEADSGRD